MITTAEISIAKYSGDLNLIIDTSNDGKHGIVHPQILTPEILIQKLRTLQEVNNQKYPIKLLLENDQHIIDISRFYIGIINKRLVYVFEVEYYSPLRSNNPRNQEGLLALDLSHVGPILPTIARWDSNRGNEAAIPLY